MADFERPRPLFKNETLQQNSPLRTETFMVRRRGKEQELSFGEVINFLAELYREGGKLDDDQRNALIEIKSDLTGFLGREELKADEELYTGVGQAIMIVDVLLDKNGEIKNEESVERKPQDTRFDRVKYLTFDFSRKFPTVSQVRKAAVNLEDYTPTGVRKLKDDYPPTHSQDGIELSFDQRKALVDDDIEKLRKLLEEIQTYLLLWVDKEADAKEKRSAIEEVAIPVINSFINKLKERKETLEEERKKQNIEEFEKIVKDNAKVKKLFTAFKTTLPTSVAELDKYNSEIDALYKEIKDEDFDSSLISRETADQIQDRAYRNLFKQEISKIEKRRKELEDDRKKDAINKVSDKVQVIFDLAKTLLTDADYKRRTLEELKKYKQELVDEIRASGLDANSVANYNEALRQIDEHIEKRKQPKLLSWEEIAEAMQENNMDPWDHEKYEGAVTGDAGSYLQKLYLEFHTRKKSPSEEVEETPEKRQERVDYKTLIQLRSLDNKLKYESERASTRRSTLFEELSKRDVVRDELLEATTYHHRYGAEIRDLLEYMVAGAAGNQEIAYPLIINEGNGRSVLEGNVKGVKEKELKAAGFSQKEIDRIFELAFLLFYDFTLVDVAFAERQKQTATRAHNTADDDLDRVLLARPDTALVHRLTRYSNFSDWSAWWLTYLPSIKTRWFGKIGDKNDPRNIGSTEDKNHILAEIQEKLLLHQEAHFPIDSVKGKIAFTELFDPLFPDTLQFLLAGKNVLGSSNTKQVGDVKYALPEFIVSSGVVSSREGVLGKSGDTVKVMARNPQTGKQELIDVTLPKKSTKVQERSQYTNAEEAWMKLMEFDFKSLAGDKKTLSEEDILTGHGGKKGILDEWIGLAGRAKMFPGRHLDDAMEPMLTHLIQRAFTLLPARGETRRRIYKDVVKKLRQAYQGGGLEVYESIIEKVIQNISQPGALGEIPGEAIQPYSTRDRKYRIAYVDYIWHERHRTIPLGGVRSTIGFNATNPHADEYWSIIDLSRPLPNPEVNRNGSFGEAKEKH